MCYVTYQVRCYKTHFVTSCFETTTTRPSWIQSYLRSRSQLSLGKFREKGGRGIIHFVFIKFLFPSRNAYTIRDSSVGIIPTLRAGQATNCSSIPYRGDKLIFPKATRTALGHSQLFTQLVHGVLSPVIKRTRCEAEQSPTYSTEFQLYLQSPHTPSCCAWGSQLKNTHFAWSI